MRTADVRMRTMRLRERADAPYSALGFLARPLRKSVSAGPASMPGPQTHGGCDAMA